ncbi:MAG: hypothetical protein HC896_03970 [Bacteroidales bacterium]|nr:hypothetical protein [Bacteroidales bacterium]
MYLLSKGINQEPLFQLQPMTFRCEHNKQVEETWKGYYQELGIDVPEGKPGINPAGIYRSENIDIVYRYPYNKE